MKNQIVLTFTYVHRSSNNNTNMVFYFHSTDCDFWSSYAQVYNGHMPLSYNFAESNGMTQIDKEDNLNAKSQTKFSNENPDLISPPSWLLTAV